MSGNNVRGNNVSQSLKMSEVQMSEVKLSEVIMSELKMLTATETLFHLLSLYSVITYLINIGFIQVELWWDF